MPRDLDTILYYYNWQVSWLKDHHFFFPSQTKVQWIHKKKLLYHSDEIVQDLHLFPFYPHLTTSINVAPTTLQYKCRYYIIIIYRSKQL